MTADRERRRKIVAAQTRLERAGLHRCATPVVVSTMCAVLDALHINNDAIDELLDGVVDRVIEDYEEVLRRAGDSRHQAGDQP